ncbi:MAG TPA: hypothetical protein VD788_00425, partial [Candidatus Polarisedimenticolaceae bacterium]|nr:hypothetical protein [Candidatus Polarisedimenticolaceae bacterium]
VVWLGLKHRNPLVFTAANPAIEAGGFIAESKYRILQSLRGAGSAVARARLLPERDSPAARLEAAKRFVEEQALDWPVVLKPDAGQRGSGVAVVRDEQALASYLAAADFDVLVQEYVPGHELGVFYYRYPGEPHGRIFSITDKRMPYVTGNGRDTLERLILLDGRAVCMAEHYLAARADQLFCVPAEGERVRLVELGTHCRGAVFLDGRRFITPDLEREIERISRTFDGFFFGRYDLRGDLGEIERGRGFKVIELNGVTSEATHIYDPARSLFGAYAILFRQWSIAFEIGRRNHDSGVPVASLRLLIDSIKRYRRLSRSHPG